jgi:hypothetical protein
VLIVLPSGATSGTADELKAADLPTGIDLECAIIAGCGSAQPGVVEVENLIAKMNAKVYIGFD